MPTKLTAWFLAYLALLGPGLCCCSVGKVSSWLSACLGSETPVCHSCCQDREARPTSPHHAQRQKGNTSDERASKQAGDQSPSCPAKCPCREDGTEPAGVPANSLATAHGLTSSLDATLTSFATSTIEIDSSISDAGIIASYACPDGIGLNGQGILRAYGRLRI